MWNVYGKIGGDAKLSERGEAYARKLPDLVKESFDVSSIFHRLFEKILTLLGK